MGEKLFEKNLREKVKAMGGLALKIWCLSFTGLPDRLILMPGGRVWFVEMKGEGTEIKKGSRQEKVKEWLQLKGFNWAHINSSARLVEFLAYLKTEKDAV